MSTCSPATTIPAGSSVTGDWRIDYNNSRPHSSLGGLTPTQFVTRSKQGHNQNKPYL